MATRDEHRRDPALSKVAVPETARRPAEVRAGLAVTCAPSPAERRT
ncbi:hypothetical protein JS756_02255 [Streptomyces actuosus]|uniref:Uncharacterized protein n=1 Tax=Streptomyces actuosus TaxID=1885 RepID=A0ABS2VIN2_STRAS|nr:hypothetical protein [Streptomyces actuosus]MBN0042957.1 hypothetical protein [Streptomyces actuosus]